MKKRLLSLFIVTFMVCSSFLGAYADAKPMANEIKPFLGGGDSHVYYAARTYNVTLSRSALVNLSYDLRAYQRGAASYAKAVDVIAAVGGMVNGYIGSISLLNLSSKIDDATNNGIEDTFDSLSRYPNSNTLFKLTYTVYKTEVPNGPTITTLSAVDKAR